MTREPQIANKLFKSDVKTHNTDSYKLRSVSKGSPILLNKIFQPIK